MPIPEITYTIEGKDFSATILAKELKCSTNTARSRLTKSKTLLEIYAPLRKENEGGVEVVHRIEGELITVQQLAKELECSVSTARIRLKQRTTLKELYASVDNKRFKENIDMYPPITKTDDELDEINKLLMGAW